MDKINLDLLQAINNYQISSHLSKGRLILLSKNKNSFPNIMNARKLIGYSHITKITEQTKINKLNQNNNSILHTPSYKKRFKKGNSTSDNILQIISLFKLKRRKRKEKIVIFLQISSKHLAAQTATSFSPASG